MAKALIYSLSLLLTLTSYGNAQNCEYQSHLQSGQSANVSSPEYSNNSSEARFCRWTATSDYRVKLTCGEFNLPSSVNCEESVLKIYAESNKSPKRYCDNRTFSVESSGGKMIIEYESRNFSRPGQFSCVLQAINETQDSDSCQCGYKNTMRIMVGNETGINEYPMMAGIINSETHEFICGATIISNKYALTEANCVKNKGFTTLGLVVGEHNTNISSETNATNLFGIEYYIIHPQYSPGQNNIAIVVVEGTIEFTNEVGPACLPFQHRRDSFAGSFLEILGWNDPLNGGEKSFALHRTIASAVTNAKCKRNYYNHIMSDAHMCTSSVLYNTWQFMDGGPVLWENPTTRKMVLVGVFTFGGIENTDVPSMNTRVGDYLDWITFNTPDAVYCMAE